MEGELKSQAWDKKYILNNYLLVINNVVNQILPNSNNNLFADDIILSIELYRSIESNIISKKVNIILLGKI